MLDSECAALQFLASFNACPKAHNAPTRFSAVKFSKSSYAAAFRLQKLKYIQTGAHVNIFFEILFEDF